MLDVMLHGFDITKVIGNVFYVILFMIAFDVLTGLLASAIEKKVNSSINYVGLIRKLGEIVALAFITFIDAYFQTNGNIVKIGAGMLIVYEGISIIENFSRIGINLSFLTKFFDENKIKRKGD